MPKTKVEVYDKDQLIYPFIESDHVTFSNGMKITEMLDQSISMPTVAHEDLSFKVGVGDQDVSSTIVDSSVADMTIKGQTYQNILPEPTLRNKMIGKSMQRLNEGYDNIEVVDGVSKSAILSGVTKYKNIDGQFYEDFNIFASCKKLVNQNLSSDGELVQSSLRSVVDYVAINDVSIVKINGLTIKNLTFYDESKNKITTIPVNTSLEYTLNIPEGAKYFRFSYDSTLSLENASITLTTLELISVKMPVLSTVGKNLSPINDYETTVWEYVQGYQGFNKVLAKNILVNENKEYRLSFTKECEDGLPTNLGNIIVQFSSIPVSSNINDHNSVYTHCQNNKGKKYAHITMPNIGQGNEYVGKRVTLTNIQLEEGSVTTSYKPYKTNILTVNGDVELRGIGDVQDTLDCLTGEVTERIGEVVLDGSEDENWHMDMVSNNDTRLNMTFKVGLDNIIDCDFATTGMLCDRFIQVTGSSLWANDVQGVGSSNGSGLKIGIPKSNLTTQDVNGFRYWLSQNPVTVQYQLKTPTIKTVDLSSSGNWEKVVLDGSEDVAKHLSGNFAYYTYGSSSITNVLPYASGGRAFASHTLTGSTGASNLVTNYKYIVSPKTTGTTGLCFSLDGSMTAEEAKAFLSQNPITVWYQTSSTVDSTQVKQPIFFKDGHIQLSSGADNSLIPTLDYQAKTSNSYVMDLMKTNTLYTMKAKTVSGTFTIDGTSYNVNANGTFTSPSSMTDKLLIMNNKTNEEVMLLEGNVIDKTIPYFKGIKSAFEDEDKIEVLSTGKNLFNISKWSSHHNDGHGYFSISGDTITVVSERNDCYTDTGVTTSGVLPEKYRNMTFSCKPNTTYTCSFTMNLNNPSSSYITFFDKYYNTLSFHGFKTSGNSIVSPNEAKYFTLRVGVHSANGETVVFSDVQVVEGSKKEEYQSHKSNSTKIPLLSPLRSLPDGTCDELIIDRMKKKATLIKRLDCITFDGSSDENWHTWGSTNSTSHLNNYHYVDGTNNTKNLKVKVDPSWIVSRLGYGGGYNSKKTGATLNSSYFAFSIPKNSIGAGSGDTDSMYEKSGRAWLSQNPITVYYELATPIVTEIDLEGYPYAYKDGHIFFNSDIAPTTQITYSINQAQQIESANENLQRHEKEISRLQKLIAQYIQVEYVSTLLSLKL